MYVVLQPNLEGEGVTGGLSDSRNIVQMKCEYVLFCCMVNTERLVMKTLSHFSVIVGMMESW